MRLRLFLAFAALELGAACVACYPKDCDPAKDPTGCQCPPGACGPYPEPPPGPGAAQDAGGDR